MLKTRATEKTLLLAIDTSTQTAGVALYGPTGLVAETSWQAGRTQTTTLMPEIARLLDLMALHPPDLGAIAIATGPGTFNGLRVGLSVAKGLTFSLGLPLLGIPTLDAIAYPYGDRQHPVRAVISAGRGRYVSAVYAWPRGQLQRLSDYANTTLDELAAQITTVTLVCGELPPTVLQTWGEQAPAAIFPVLHAPVPRVVALAELGWTRWQRGEQDDVAVLEPVYLHAPPPEEADKRAVDR